MVRDMVTGGVWTPDTDTVRDFYNLGRWVDDTAGDTRGASTSQGERESEFDRWLEGERAAAVAAYRESVKPDFSDMEV
jgi:hypothetical protein